MNELSDDQLMLLKLMAEGGGGFLIGREHRKTIQAAVEEIERLRHLPLIARETQDEPEKETGEIEKCVWCGETKRDRHPGMFECGSGPAYGQSLDCALRQVEQLEAALSAAMRIIRRPGMLMWGVNKEQQDQGYWVRINNDWQFAGPEPLDAINLLAGIGK